MSTQSTMETEPATRSIFPVLLFNFIVYLNVGLPMAVIPVFVHSTLQYSAVIAGLAISLQYIGTFLSRPSASRWIDTTGPRGSAKYGLMIAGGSGLLMIIAAAFQSFTLFALVALLLSRLALGWSESWVSTSVIVWNIYRAGAQKTAYAISWNGITSYGGIAIGATLGQLMSNGLGQQYGLILIGLITTVLGLGSWALCRTYTPIRPKRDRATAIPFLRVMWMVLPHGSVLVCGSIGFSAIWSYLALYFSVENWQGAAWGLLLFGIAFIIVRLLFGRQIVRKGGAYVSLISLAVEAIGLFLICLIPDPTAACIGAMLTGAGFSLIFPAIGTLAVDRVGPQNRGAAVGCFALYFDIAVAISAPLLGFIIEHQGYRTLYLLSACIPAIGILIVRFVVQRLHTPEKA